MGPPAWGSRLEDRVKSYEEREHFRFNHHNVQTIKQAKPLSYNDF
jgi:hypothetical protein